MRRWSSWWTRSRRTCRRSAIAPASSPPTARPGRRTPPSSSGTAPPICWAPTCGWTASGRCCKGPRRPLPRSVSSSRGSRSPAVLWDWNPMTWCGSSHERHDRDPRTRAGPPPRASPADPLDLRAERGPEPRLRDRADQDGGRGDRPGDRLRRPGWPAPGGDPVESTVSRCWRPGNLRSSAQRLRRGGRPWRPAAALLAAAPQCPDSRGAARASLPDQPDGERLTAAHGLAVPSDRGGGHLWRPTGGRDRRRDPARPRAHRTGAYQGRPSRCATRLDRKSTRLNSSHVRISYAVFCLKKKKNKKSIKKKRNKKKNEQRDKKN